MTEAARPAAASGTFAIGGDLEVHRLGFGAMQLTGPGVWGEPRDPAEAVRVLRRAVELGIDFIDTADSYGPVVSERLIREALHPYPDGLVIATKAGLTRPGPGTWVPNGHPAYLRGQVEQSLRTLRLERIDLLQLHRVDPAVPLAESLGELGRLRDEGKIRHIGLSQVSVVQLDEALTVVPVVSVQNLYNLADRSAEDVLDHAAARGIAFIPWFPLATGALARPGGRLAKAAAAHGAMPSQLALAWLLRRSPVMLPIPGTSRLTHLEENVAAAAISLTAADVDELERIAPKRDALRSLVNRIARRRSS